MSAAGFLAKLLNGGEVAWKPLGEVVGIQRGRRLVRSQLEETGKFAVFQNSMKPLGFYHDSNVEADTTFVICAGAAGEIGYSASRFWAADDVHFFQTPNGILSKYIYHWLLTQQSKISSQVRRASIPRLSKSVLELLVLPIPCPDDPQKSLAIQGEIVRILDSFTELTTELTAELTAELTQRKKQYNHYGNQLLTFDEDNVEWKTLGEVFDIFAGGDVPKQLMSRTMTDEYQVPILSNGIGDRSLYGWTNKAKVEKPSLTVSARGTIGWTSYRDKPFFPIVRLIVLTPKIGINLKYAYYFMKSIENNYKVPEAGIPQLTKPMIEDTPFPIPHPADPAKSLAEQARIVAILDKFDKLTTSINEGLPREIALREKQYAYYRDQLLSFRKPDAEAA